MHTSSSSSGVTPHLIDRRLLSDRVNVLLVGAGGNGSQMLTGLARLDRALLARGHPGGLHVTVVDDDRVSEVNVGRQLFYPADVGLPKAEVLVNRVNLTYGLDWIGEQRRASPAKDALRRHRIVVGCVDTRASRRAIASVAAQCGASYWLDLGNSRDDGQVVLGEPDQTWRGTDQPRLPTILDLYPELLDAAQPEPDDGPSCSLAEALEKQSLFVNQMCVTAALNLLDRLFRFGQIEYHGMFFSLATGRSSPLPVSEATWARFGYTPQRATADGEETGQAD